MENTKLNYSELLYLNADKYAPNASFLQPKEELPNGKKLNIVKLGNIVAEAAFAYLYFNGHIDLKLETRKRLGIFNRKVVVSTKKSNYENSSSLEKPIFELSNGLDVKTIIYKVIGQESPVPWSVITNIVKESLVKKEILIKEQITKKLLVTFVSYKYHLNPSKKQVFDDEISQVDSKLKEFSKLDFYKELVKGIESGIKAQVQKPDDDSD